MLKLFITTLTANDKYSLLNRDNLEQQIQMQLFQKQKTFYWLFSAFLKSNLNFDHFQKQDNPDGWCSSETTDSNTTKLDQSLISLPWEDPSKGSILNRPKHCQNMNDTTFTIFIDHCQGDWVLKSLC